MKKTVFLLEDDDPVAFLTETLMRHYGASVDIIRARTISEALSLFFEKGMNYDVAFLDYSLPDGLGTTLMETLRKKAPQCRIIVYSSHIDVDADTTRIIRRQNPDVMLSKPFKNEIFEQMLRNVGLI